MFVSFVETGSERDFRELFESANPRLLNMVYKLTNDAEAASDAVQEAWIKAVESKANFDPNRGKFANYIYTIAKHEAFKRMRKEKRTSTLDDEEHSGYRDPEDTIDRIDPHVLAERTEIGAVIGEAVTQLRKNYQDVIIMFYMMDLDIKSIAETMDRPEGTIKVWLKRAREKLEKKLNKNKELLMGGL